MNFNPRSPCGERPNGIHRVYKGIVYFNPRSPCGERQQPRARSSSSSSFQSTLPVWGATKCYYGRQYVASISIHAPRVGSDKYQSQQSRLDTYFNPRSPCGERLFRRVRRRRKRVFQSTLPVWGATLDVQGVRRTLLFQSTLPVWGATGPPAVKYTSLVISIHAPRVGSDYVVVISLRNCSFQSTLPVWGATSPRIWCARGFGISIHAPRVGSDARYCRNLRFE